MYFLYMYLNIEQMQYMVGFTLECLRPRFKKEGEEVRVFDFAIQWVYKNLQLL